MEYKSEKRICQNCKKDFTVEPDDFGFYEKIKVPLPTLCPECRLQRRLAWRNERGLHNRECGLCGKKIISIYNKDLNNIVYCNKCWWGDKWDALDYAEDIDFSKPFVTQFFELFHKVPAINLFAFGANMINSQYCNMANDMKNCYLLHDGTFDENVSYGSGAFFTKDSEDITMVRKCELCYEIVTCINCYQTLFSQNCIDCVDVYFSHSLRGCNNCFGCVNLHGKSYHIWNVPYTKEEYRQKLKSLGLDSHKNITLLKDKAHKFWKKFPKKYYFGVQNLNVTGDYLEHSKNAKSCFGAANLEDSKFCSFVSNGPVKTTYDFTHYGDNIEMVYECLQSGDGIYNTKFGWGNWSNTNNANYSITVPGSSYVFGCVGLKKKKYCILNKQYTQEEYEKLVPRIIKHMNNMPYIDKKGVEYKYGEFFPIELSPFGYNETTAQEYFFLNQNQVKENGYNWREHDKRSYEITKNPEEVPNSINEIDNSILDEIIACEHKEDCKENCMAAFRIFPEDLKFYRRMNLPLPRLCPNCRHYQRLKQRNPLKLWHRQCMCDKKHPHHEGRCDTQFETTYSPDRPEIIYCERCYQQEIY
jgi:Zn ribbon nucleic-acid-binding protein